MRMALAYRCNKPWKKSQVTRARSHGRSMAAVLTLGLGLGSGWATGASLAWAQEKKTERVVIHFVDLGGIEDWRVGEDGSLIIEGRNGARYRATFFGPCSGLRFANTIGFVTDPTGDLDRFSSILVDGERCYFRTLEKLDPESTGVPEPSPED